MDRVATAPSPSVGGAPSAKWRTLAGEYVAGPPVEDLLAAASEPAARVEDLATLFDVSPKTVRRALIELGFTRFVREKTEPSTREKAEPRNPVDPRAFEVAVAHGSRAAGDWAGVPYPAMSRAMKREGLTPADGRRLSVSQPRRACECPMCEEKFPPGSATLEDRAAAVYQRRAARRLIARTKKADSGFRPHPVVTENWRAHAACRGLDPALFIPDRDEPVKPEALKVCGTCPVQAQCRHLGRTEHEKTDRSVWAGEIKTRPRKETEAA